MKLKKYFKFILFSLILTLFFIFTLNIKTFGDNEYYIFFGSGVYKTSNISYVYFAPYFNFNFLLYSDIEYFNIDSNLFTILYQNNFKILNFKFDFAYMKYFNFDYLNVYFILESNDFPKLVDENLPFIYSNFFISYLVNKNFTFKFLLETNYDYYINQKDNFNLDINFKFLFPIDSINSICIDITNGLISDTNFTNNFIFSRFNFSPFLNINPITSIYMNLNLDYEYSVNYNSNYFLKIFYNINYGKKESDILSYSNLIHFQYNYFFIPINSYDLNNFLLKYSIKVNFLFNLIEINYKGTVENYFYLNSNLSILQFENQFITNLKLIHNFILSPSLVYTFKYNFLTNLIIEKKIKINFDINFIYNNFSINLVNIALFEDFITYKLNSLESFINIKYKVSSIFSLKLIFYYKLIYNDLTNEGNEIFYIILGANLYF
jgi:hypothetical protein